MEVVMAVLVILNLALGILVTGALLEVAKALNRLVNTRENTQELSRVTTDTVTTTPEKLKKFSVKVRG